MKLNHLLSERTKKVVCREKSKKGCYWTSTGTIKATNGDNVGVELNCKKCNMTIFEFISHEQYHLCEKQILN